jgi:S-DNA-T family DNA segregation ATPase FtsK/SpoIIIE
VELGLRIGVNGSYKDVRVEADTQSTVADLVEAVKLELGVAADADVVCPRLGGSLDAASTLTNAGVLNGDIIELVPRGKYRTVQNQGAKLDVRVIVEVVDGPFTGAAWSLEPGVHDVGRSPAGRLFLNDSAVALRHVSITVAEDGSTFIVPRDTTHLDGVELRDGSVRIPSGGRLRVGESTLTFRARATTLSGGVDKAGQVLFNRTPHFFPVLEPHTIARIEQPPQPPQKSPTNWFAVLAPLVMGLVLYLMTRQVITLAFVAMMPLMSLGTTMFSKKEARNRFANQRNRWLEELERIRGLASEELDRERISRFDLAPSGDQVRQWIENGSAELWRRSVGDESFLHLRVGVGSVPSSGVIEFEQRFNVDSETSDLVEAAEALVEQSKAFDQAPIVCDMKQSPVLGVWGPSSFTSSVASAWLLQMTALHSPQDLIVCAACGEDEALLRLAKWSPHANSTASPLEGAHWAANPVQARALCEALLNICEQRGADRYSNTAPLPHILLLVTDEAGVELSTLSRLLDRVQGRGVSVMFVAKDHGTLPRQCSAVLGGTLNGAVRYESPAGVIDVIPDALEISVSEQATLRLAPYRDAAAGSAAASIPRQVPLSGVLKRLLTEPENVKSVWSTANAATLRAPIGMDADGEWLLDVVENGPHGLIAGTSGAGKSELLQSMVVSLAAHYPPHMLNFLFVDYKGGAAFGPCLELPHTVGMVTDLDEALALRALTSLRAELKRRENVLAGRARDIVELAKLYPDDCPSRLMIVVDEFATLVKEVPEFVAGMVDVAQRGRSLGIHLVLATQRPAGSVSDNILANTNLRICLRVLDASDSSGVIGTSDAAGIPAPLRGRAYVRTGPRDLACVQTAWANAPLGGETLESVRISPLGSGVVAGPKIDSDGPAELTVAVSTIKQAAYGMPEPMRPWLEPLGGFISLADVLEMDASNTASRKGNEVVFGVLDDPENQAQHPVSVDWEADGGLLVLGSGGSGRTTALRTIAGSLASMCSPSQVALYGIDFNNRALEQLLPLPHTVEIAHADNAERVTAVIVALEQHVNRNRALLVEHQVSAFSELLEKGVRAQRSVLLLDDYGTFHAALEKFDVGDWVTRLHQIVSRGRQAGVHVVLTADRRASVPSALFSSIGKRVVLRMADQDELVALGVRQGGDVPDGRGWLSRGSMCQIAVVGDAAAAGSQAESLRALAGRSEEPRLERLGVLPNAVQLESIQRPGEVMLGVEDLVYRSRGLDLDIGHLIVSGPPRSGRTNFLRSIAEQAIRLEGCYVFAISGNGTLQDERWLCGDRESMEEVLQAVLSASTTTDLRCSALLLVDDAEDLAEGPIASRLQECVSAPGVRVIAASESHFWSRAYSGWMADVKRQRRSLFLQPDLEADGQVASVRLRVRPGVVFEPGRGIYVADGSQVVVQTPLATS